MTNDLRNLANTASKLVENHRQIDEWLESIVWVASTPDKKTFATQMQQLGKLRKEGKRIQISLDKIVKKAFHEEEEFGLLTPRYQVSSREIGEFFVNEAANFSR